MATLKSINWKEIDGDNLKMSYAHNFLSKDDADKLLEQLENELQYFSGDLAKVRVFGKWHSIPRQQVAFGEPGTTYKFSGLNVPALTWPNVLAELRDEINDILGFDYNFVLVNRYRNGQDHMGEHRDDEAELDVNAGIVSLSLGQEREFVMRHVDCKKRLRRGDPYKIILAHGSLLHMKPPTNSFWFHSLPVKRKLNGVRINLTFRKINLNKIKIE